MVRAYLLPAFLLGALVGNGTGSLVRDNAAQNAATKGGWGKSVIENPPKESAEKTAERIVERIDATKSDEELKEVLKSLSQGELAAAWAELTALSDAVESVGAQSTSSDSQLAELRGELARERQARVMAVESEQARTSVVEAHLDEQRHTYDAQMKSAERKADAAMKTAQKDRQLLAQARDERDVAERIAADLRVEKDGLERAGVDLREQLKFLRETVGHQKETIESLRLQTPQVIPRSPTMVAIGRVDGFTSPKVASLSGVVTAQKMDNDVDASVVEQVYVLPKTKGEVSPEMSVASTQAESPPPAFANATRHNFLAMTH